MDFLRFLEGVRTPAATAFFSLVTYCGSEIFFMAAAVTVCWCVSKRRGYYILAAGFFGTTLSQFLKLWFRIPRPWVLDPGFHVVESARAGAAGYSFPSGHTQNSVGTAACLLLTEKNKVVRAGAAALMLLVPFSRMYLGCHTPLDVGVAFVLAWALALVLRPAMVKSGENSRPVQAVLLLAFATALCLLAFVSFFPFPSGTDAGNLQSGIKNAWKLLGSLSGLIAAKTLDDRYIHYQVEAVWWAQILKVTLGLAFAAILLIGLKIPLAAVLPVPASEGVRYFLLAVFLAAAWPMTFQWFAKWGKAAA